MSLSLTQPPWVEVLPSKLIMFWGLAFDVGLYPQLGGWVLCNGANGTHDMREQMTRGTPGGGSTGDTGGVTDHRHWVEVTTSSISHGHPGGSTNPRAHTHVGSNVACCDHDHAGSVADIMAWSHTHGDTGEASSHSAYDVRCVDTNLYHDYFGISEGCGHRHWVGHSGPGGLHGHEIAVPVDCHKHIATIAQDIHDHIPTVVAQAHTHPMSGDTGIRADLWPLYRDLYLIMKL